MKVKKIIYTACVFSCLILAGCQKEENKTAAEKQDFSCEETVLQEEPTEFKIVFPVNGDAGRVEIKSFLGKEEIQKDVEGLFYILKNAYVSYSESAALGLEEEAIKSKLEKLADKAGGLSGKEYEESLCTLLSPYIKDRHFRICGLEEHQILKHNDLYLSDVYLKKKRRGFYVCSSPDKRLKGKKYTGSEGILFRYSSKGRNIYRLCYIGSDEQSLLRTSFNDVEQGIPVYINEGKAGREEQEKSFLVSNDTAYIRLKSFLPEDFDEILDKLNQREIIKTKRNIIVDLRKNSAGVETNAMGLALYLCTSCLDAEKVNEYQKDIYSRYGFVSLRSPATFQAALSNCSTNEEKQSVFEKNIEFLTASPRNKYVGFIESRRFVTEGNGFKGNIIILTDRYTGSSAEVFIACLKDLAVKSINIITVGENTSGSSLSEGIYSFMLPYSNLVVEVPYAEKDFCSSFADNMGEGFGFYPDYLSTDEDMPLALSKILKDKSLSTIFF